VDRLKEFVASTRLDLQLKKFICQNKTSLEESEEEYAYLLFTKPQVRDQENDLLKFPESAL
jgi:hypothetical protein